MMKQKRRTKLEMLREQADRILNKIITLNDRRNRIYEEIKRRVMK